MSPEFDLIQRYFTRAPRHTDLAVGDDAALMSPTAGMQLVVSTDMLVAGTHFLVDTDPRDVGWKTLAVNVSDIAAMGAQPRWAVLAVALPERDTRWVGAFAEGFFECADAHGVDLAGGDTTRGPRTLCVTIFGEVPHNAAITRDGARPGDDIWITGQPGRAALGLAHLQSALALPEAVRADFVGALHRPQPRLQAGLGLRGIASAMLDVSDGLLGDLRHILERSGVGAEIDIEHLPLAALHKAGVAHSTALQACLSGGDDYELLFTAPRAQREAIASLGQRLALPMTRIGAITDVRDALHLRETDGSLHAPERFGYDHFAK